LAADPNPSTRTRDSKTPGRVAAPGDPFPLGASIVPGGVNFSVYARGAERVDLLLFRGDDDVAPSDVISLDPVDHRSYHYWHARVRGLEAGQRYAYRARGPFDPARGLRFNGTWTLLDPYGLGVSMPKGWSRATSCGDGDPAAPKLKSVVLRTDDYDWEGDQPLHRPFSRSIIYEMHVRGFTAHPNSGVPADRRGTYAGLIDKIPYLKDLGITSVELLPVFQYDPEEAPPGRRNYWGYSPLSFFTPHAGYARHRDPAAVLDEFRDLVKALHRADLDVFLDVVYNHTAEGNEHGPTYSFRGLANDTYYLLESGGARYANYSGCGNTFNANHPVSRRMILDSLRYWVREMHVDGFRFDLASILSRDESGRPTKRAPVLFDLESDPVLARTKLIAEAWDAAGLYEVGSFAGDSWREWNGRFRDDLRSFLKGEDGKSGAAAERLLGSPDLYGHENREPEQSINFITCHDGFTLNDLVTYDRKHNDANGENNRDGSDDNRSWNCGVEGPSADPAIEALRNRQVKNFLTLTLLAVGAPMILMGDEVRRTQKGNNNAYSQDNEGSWFDWKDVDRHADLLRFMRLLTRTRLMKAEHGLTLPELLRRSTIEWHGVRLNAPDWSPSSHSLSVSVKNVTSQRKFQILVNAHWGALTFELSEPEAGGWRRFVDTALPSPEDIASLDEARPVRERVYRVEGRTVVVLSSGPSSPPG
jgi:glycogen operon protein